MRCSRTRQDGRNPPEKDDWKCEPVILAQVAISFKLLFANATEEFVFFCIPVSRVMGRKGWSSLPNGWVQVIRGPRPLSEKWPTIGRTPDRKVQPRGRWRRQSPDSSYGQPGQRFQPSTRGLAPEEVRQEAATKIARLEAALLTLGPEDQTEKAVLEVSLRKARQQAIVPPVADQIEHTTKFLERAKKRLSNAAEWVQWAQDWHSQCSKDITEAEERLARLQTESVFSRVSSSHPVQSSVEAVQLEQERAAKRRACGEELPTTAQQLAEWLCNKHLELRDALELGDACIVAELTQLLAKGGAQMQLLAGTAAAF